MEPERRAAYGRLWSGLQLTLSAASVLTREHRLSRFVESLIDAAHMPHTFSPNNPYIGVLGYVRADCKAMGTIGDGDAIGEIIFSLIAFL